MGRRHLLLSMLAVISLLAGTDWARAEENRPAKPSGDFFEKTIRPLLAAHCFECHGSQKHKGGLRLDSREAAIKGGENGPDIVPGSGEKSPLLHNVARIGDEDDAMPPEGKGDPLTKDQVALIRAWIDQGAK